MTAQTVETLTQDECWALLRTQPVGRLATAAAGEPDIFPLSYAAADGYLYVRTSPGSKLAEVAVNRRVAFEADEWASDVATSVVVHGTAEILEHHTDVEAAEATGLVSFVSEGKDVWVRITPETITGRRLTR